MDFPKKQQQCLIPRYLLQYLQDLQISHNDPTAPWGGGGGGGSYTAGDGIDITNDVISVDDTVALKTDLLDYVTSSELVTELSNYITSTDLATELLDYAELSDLSTVATTGDYNDLLNKPTIPTKTSDLTNDSGYITSGALSDYVTTNTYQTISGRKAFTGDVSIEGSYFSAYFQPVGTLVISDNNNPLDNYMTIYPNSIRVNHLNNGFNLGGQQLKVYNSNNEYKIKITDNNDITTYGEYTFKNKIGDVAITSEIPDAVSGTNDGTNWTSLTIGNTTYSIPSGSGSSYSAGTGIDITNNVISIDNTVALKSDIPSLTGYATETWVTNQGYSTFSGSYTDLTNKPTIPTISGSYSGSYWTSININGTSKSIPSASYFVTTDTAQNITNTKTFVGEKRIAFKQGASSNNNVLGFTAYKYNGNEYGNLQIASRTVGGVSNDYITLGNYSSNTTKAKVGFRIQPNSSTNSYNFVMPFGTNTDFTDNTYSTSADTTIPCSFTDGTTIVKADATGLVDISSLISSSGSSSMSNYLITFVGSNSGTNCDILIRCTLKDNSTLVPGTYTTFNQTLIDYLNNALVGITTYNYETGGIEIFTSFYYVNSSEIEYDGFTITELTIDQLSY